SSSVFQSVMIAFGVRRHVAAFQSADMSAHSIKSLFIMDLTSRITHCRIALGLVSQSRQHPRSKHAGADIFEREFLLAPSSPAVTGVRSTSSQRRPQSLLATATFVQTLWLALLVLRRRGLSRSIYVDSASR